MEQSFKLKQITALLLLDGVVLISLTREYVSNVALMLTQSSPSGKTPSYSLCKTSERIPENILVTQVFTTATESSEL